MGHTPYVRSSNIWHTGEGRAEFVRILRAHVKSLQPDNYNEINAQITWDDELEKHMQNIRFFGPSDLRPIPEAVNEAAFSMADVYVTRWRMHNRLATVRERTAVAPIRAALGRGTTFTGPSPASDNHECTLSSTSTI